MQKEALLGPNYFTGSMPLLTSNHSFKICGGPEALDSSAICQKCGVETSFGDHDFVKSNYNLPFPNIPMFFLH